MVLYPIVPSHEVHESTVIPAWDAIERKQRQVADDWWLISQPDHAALSASLAASIQSPDFPQLDEDILEAIGLHDEGWAWFDRSCGARAGRPMSFLNVDPPDFLQAWCGSIERAARASAVGGIMVSEHFCRIARMRPPSKDGALIERFLKEEEHRQVFLAGKQTRNRAEIEILVDVLQFCDLLSLYLCCGSHDNTEFPQKFGGRTIRLYRESDLCRMQPAIFGGGLSLAVQARRFSDPARSESIPALLA